MPFKKGVIVCWFIRLSDISVSYILMIVEHLCVYELVFCLGAVRVGLIENEVVINPTRRQLQHSALNLIVTGAKGKKVGK